MQFAVQGTFRLKVAPKHAATCRCQQPSCKHLLAVVGNRPQQRGAFVAQIDTLNIQVVSHSKAHMKHIQYQNYERWGHHN